MKIFKYLPVVVLFVLLGCDKKENKFPTDKKYWDITDYENSVRELKYNYTADEKLPTFSDPETQVVIQKLTDKENFKVVLDDNSLGIKHRNEVGQKFFDIWQDMLDVYTATDKQDKFIYENELLSIFDFGYHLQLRYFKLGNDEIIEASEDPKASEVADVLNSNTDTFISNTSLYLDQINKEKSYSSIALDKYANNLEVFFVEVFKLYPDYDYTELENKVNLLYKKAKSDSLKLAMKNITLHINKLKKKE